MDSERIGAQPFPLFVFIAGFKKSLYFCNVDSHLSLTYVKLVGFVFVICFGEKMFTNL